jgi:hypothetical protein
VLWQMDGTKIAGGGEIANPGPSWHYRGLGDFNGDGKSDITGRVLENGQWWTGVSNGAAFNTSLWASWSPAVNWVDVQAGTYS